MLANKLCRLQDPDEFLELWFRSQLPATTDPPDYFSHWVQWILVWELLEQTTPEALLNALVHVLESRHRQEGASGAPVPLALPGLGLIQQAYHTLSSEAFSAHLAGLLQAQGTHPFWLSVCHTCQQADTPGLPQNNHTTLLWGFLLDFLASPPVAWRPLLLKCHPTLRGWDDNSLVDPPANEDLGQQTVPRWRHLQAFANRLVERLPLLLNCGLSKGLVRRVFIRRPQATETIQAGVTYLHCWLQARKARPLKLTRTVVLVEGISESLWLPRLLTGAGLSTDTTRLFQVGGHQAMARYFTGWTRWFSGQVVGILDGDATETYERLQPLARPGDGVLLLPYNAQLEDLYPLSLLEDLLVAHCGDWAMAQSLVLPTGEQDDRLLWLRAEFQARHAHESTARQAAVPLRRLPWLRDLFNALGLPALNKKLLAQWAVDTAQHTTYPLSPEERWLVDHLSQIPQQEAMA